MKRIKSKNNDTYYLVLEETSTEYKVIQTLEYDGIGEVQIIAWSDKRMYDIVEIDFIAGEVEITQG
jgi:hypothetical protein